MTNREAMEYAAQHSFIELYDEGRRQGRYEQIMRQANHDQAVADACETMIDKTIENALWYLWAAHIKVDQEDMEKYIRKMVDLEQIEEQKNE